MTLQGYRAVARLRNADTFGAARDCSEVVRLDPSEVSAWNNRALAKIEAADFEGAIKDCDEALLNDHKESSAWCNRAAAKHSLGDPPWRDRRLLRVSLA